MRRASSPCRTPSTLNWSTCYESTISPVACRKRFGTSPRPATWRRRARSTGRSSTRTCWISPSTLRARRFPSSASSGTRSPGCSPRRTRSSSSPRFRRELVAAGHQDLYYWRSPGGKAELDFLCEIGPTIVPVEVKAGLSLRSKSLKSYDEQHAPPVLVRANLLNLKRDGKICNVPLYAVSWLSRRPAAICVWDLDTASSEGGKWTR